MTLVAGFEFLSKEHISKHLIMTFSITLIQIIINVIMILIAIMVIIMMITITIILAILMIKIKIMMTEVNSFVIVNNSLVSYNI